ncbi:DUF4185 domain-containing protein [Planctomycetales bacterium ZRK34]|nr:DUF4185 domain-containing protein [Planctomycetales bacterium ZRK34]
MRTALLLCVLLAVSARAAEPFVIHCIDDQTGRGIPLVELTTTNHLRYISDSAGVVTFDEPGLLNQRVWFNVSSHGYEASADGFGNRGKAFDVKPGGSATIKLHRINIAERLYRVTGQGIYADSVKAGLDTPLTHPALNGQVMGQDSVQRTIYRGKIRWFWGDTSRASYPLGHFGTAGATSLLPTDGGLDPAQGVDLDYFVDDKTGFSRPMFKIDRKGLIWIDGVTTVKDDAGQIRLICHYALMKNLGERLEHGLAFYNDQTDHFGDLLPMPDDAPLEPTGHVFKHTDAGVEYLYFANPWPTTRVRSDWQAVRDLSRYEAWTQLDNGSYGWKRNVKPVDEKDPWLKTADAATGKTFKLHRGSVAYNDYRRCWIMIANEIGGSSMLGEVWYLEAPQPQGPWHKAVKIATHQKYSFYNPVHHEFFDQDGGRVIYFEGTYTAMFSGNDNPTPRYEYNQIMYRLDLADPRLEPAHIQIKQ